MKIPYLGVHFADKIENGFLVVKTIDAGSPAETAGMTVGQKHVAMINWTTNERVPFTGYEALKGRTKLHSYEMANKYIASKQNFWHLFEGKKIAFEDQAGEKFVLDLGHSRPWRTVDWRVILAVSQSLIVLLIGLGIWSFAPRSMAVRLLAFSGISLSINMLTGGVTHSVEFQTAPESYKFHYILNTCGGLMFVYGLIAFLWHFPSRINRFPFAFCALTFGFFAFCVQYFQWFEFPGHPFQTPNLITLPIAAIISAVQWRRTRNNPIDRASMMWVMMTIFGFTTIVVLLYSIPILLRFPPIISPLFATVSLTLIYIGIALGTLKYRLFDIHRIWWKAVTWLAGGFMVLLTDIGLVSFMNLEQRSALPLALLLAGWLYFPIRQAIMRLFVEDREVQMTDNIPILIDTFSQVQDAGEFDGRFAAFLKNVFKASEIGELGRDNLRVSTIEQNGLALRVPNISNSSSVLLVGKTNGRQIFSPRDAVTADSFVRLARNMDDARKRELATLKRDRERIVRDLHDDVGGRLLSLIYQSGDEKTAEQARDALGALKESLIVVEDAETVEFSLAWQKIISEVKTRYKVAKKKFSQTSNFESERVLSAREFVNFKRIVQELISNSLKYSDKSGSTLSLEVDSDATIILRCQNRVSSTKCDDFTGGRGLPNIRKRLEEIGGTIDVSLIAGTKGKKVFDAIVTIPIAN